jgi:hypothetical protein
MQPSKIERQAQANLIRIAEAWCAATGRSLDAAGRLVKGDQRFFHDIKKRCAAGDRQPGDREGSVTFRVYDDIVEWFNNISNWPEELAYKIPKLADLSHNPKDTQYAATQRIEESTERRNRPEKASQSSRGEDRITQGSSATALIRKLRQR